MTEFAYILRGKRSLATFAVKDGAARRRQSLLLAVCGLAVGLVNGLFGAGGGMLAVPVLTFAAGLSAKKAHATAIAVILPLCVISSAVYAFKGSFDYSVFPPVIIGVLVGGIIGALALKKASGTLVSFLFYGLMLFAGLKMMM